MNNNGPIVIVEDNEGAQQLLCAIFEDMEYKNELLFFCDVDEALYYLVHTPVIPFLILSDVNLKTDTGFSLKKQIHENMPLQLKSIPFLFFSTAASRKDIELAYFMGCQGFFLKPPSIDILKDDLNIIMQYWDRCLVPHDM